MSRKMILRPYPLVLNGDMSDTIVSEEIDIVYQDNVGVQLIFTGDPVGEFKVECTIDGINWVELDFGAFILAEGEGDSYLLNINQLPYIKLRVRYDEQSGGGSLNVYILAKSIGA